MPKLIIERENQKISEHPVKEGTITIGREKDNDIQLHDPAVSGHHAKVVNFFKPTYIQDLRSTNGTYVNGKRIMQHTLMHGDVITIGKNRIVYDKEHEVSAVIPSEQTVEMDTADIGKTLQDTEKK